MRCVRRVAWSIFLAALLTSTFGCTSADTPTAADQLTTFATDFLRQLLAAFLL